MEPANGIFPVFSQLYADEVLPSATPAEAISCERPAHRAYANDAGLFVVTSQAVEQSDEPEEVPAAKIKLTCNVSTDLAAGLYCLAFLAEFFNSTEPGDLRQCADEIETRQ
jgi:hypothetical protein